MNLQNYLKRRLVFKVLLVACVFILSGWTVHAACITSPVSYWQLEEDVPGTDGDFADFTGTHTAECGLDADTACPSQEVGIVGSGQAFTASGVSAGHGIDVADHADFDWANDSSFSIEVWVNASGTTDTDVIIGRIAGPNAQWFIALDSSGNPTFLLKSDGGEVFTITGKDSITDGSWHHIVAVREGSAGLSTGFNSLYVDGELVGKAVVTYTGGFGATTAINIGYYDAGNPVTDTQFHLTGAVDEVALYDSALSANEIWAHYLNANQGSGYCDAMNAMVTVQTPTSMADAALGFLYDEPLIAAGNPLPDFSEGASANFPVGMDVSGDAKNIEWMPNDDYLGLITVDVLATNTGSSDSGDYSIYVEDLCQANDPMTAYWQLEEDVPGTDADFADFNGTHTGECGLDADTACPSQAAGIIGNGQAFTASGVSDGHGIDVADHADFDWANDSSFSIEVWVKASGTTDTDVIIGRIAGPNAQWFIALDSLGNPTFLLKSDGGETFTITGKDSITNGNWHHIVAVREGSTGFSTGFNSLYVDGELVGKAVVTYTGGFDTTTAINIGYYDAGNPLTDTQFHLTGTIDEVALYNTALSGAMIRQHFSGGIPGRSYCNIQPSILSGGTLAFTEGDGPTPINAAITITDTDDTNLEGATITISGNYQAAEDVLAFTDTANISGSFDVTTGTLVLTGSDSVANYETALKAITYDNTIADPTVLDRTVSYRVNDGYYNSTAAASTITVAQLADDDDNGGGGGGGSGGSCFIVTLGLQ
ncbi:LamG domain-containing protein [Thermodesulfobacteriota bacterium]